MNTIGEKHGPENSRSPDREDNNAFDVRRRRDFLPSCDQLTDRRTKMHSSDQLTEKASVAKEPGNAYLEKKRSQRKLEGDANGSKVKPWGRNRD